jgi:hypothetical protein
VTVNEKNRAKSVPIWKYFCVTYEKGHQEKELFCSSSYQLRDGAVREVQQFLQKHPEYINEWVN